VAKISVQKNYLDIKPYQKWSKIMFQLRSDLIDLSIDPDGNEIYLIPLSVRNETHSFCHSERSEESS
jgi:hypothetical protein